MTNAEYWNGRQEAMYEAGEMQVNQYFTKLERALNQTKKELRQVVNDFYGRYADENGVSFSEAQRLLDKAEIGELQNFIDLSTKNIGKYSQEVNNMSIKARMTRYQALETQVDAILNNVYAVDFEAYGKAALQDIYEDTYYRTWYNIDQYRGFHSNFAQFDPRTFEALIEYPFNGADFSSRLWKQKDHLQTQLMESLTTMMTQGKNPQSLAADFAKKLDSKKSDAYRLLHTESSFLIGQATEAGYKEDDVEKYKVLATLDSKTCGICGGLDGSVHMVSKSRVGVNKAPFHEYCRCTDIPHYDDVDMSDTTRVAFDPETGKPYDVPANMSYGEWHKEYIESDPKKLLAEKKIQNIDADRSQYENYKENLGKKNIPPTFAEFQNLKYTDPEEYGILKAQSRGMLYYNKAVEAEPAITQLIKDVADKSGMDVKGLENRVKAKDSYLEKICRKYSPDGNEYEVKDILRYTYVASPNEMVRRTEDAIELFKQSGYNIIKVDNRWLNEMDPYNGINATLRTVNGQAFELQFHTSESFAVKNGRMHELYEEQRLISDRDSMEYIKLDDMMFELSDSMEVPAVIERLKNE